MSNLKEYIKSLTREILDEESASGDAGAYLTPNAFKGKRKGDNAATKESERLGFTKVKQGMPSDSKVKDYKAIWGKKKTYKLYKESDYDKASPSSNPSLYSQASPYTGGGIKGDDYYKKESMNESIVDIIKEELLSEVTYGKFKNEVKLRTKSEQLHKAIREVKRKLHDIDRIVEYTSRMKQELSEGEDGVKYWKTTQKNLSSISEMVDTLNNKIKSLNQ
jgi:hypothetical protein